MKTVFLTLGKIIIVFASAFVAFFVMMIIVGPIGAIPQSITSAFPASALSRSGLLGPGLLLLQLAVFIHLIFNFLFLQKAMPLGGPWRGILFGIAFGGLWFLGFMEMIVTYRSPALPQIMSGLRDFTAFVAFGTAAGLLFARDRATTVAKRESLAVVVPVAAGFALGHGLQYYFTLPAVKQGVSDPFVAVYLLVTGAWIGLMYYFLSPKIDNVFFKAGFFAFNLFFIDWFLYDLFFNLFLDIPIVEVVIRCLSGAAGVFLGVIAYEYAKKAIEKRTAGGRARLLPGAK